MTMFDLLIAFFKKIAYSEQVDFLLSIITNFYFYFNWLGLFLRFVFFPVYSGFLETGYIKTWKKIVDAIFYHYILISIGAGIIIVGVIFLIIYTDEIMGFYDNYGSLILNSLNFVTLVEVYMHVGYFIVQNFIACRRKCNKNVNYSYYTDLENLVKKKMNKDIDKMNIIYKELSKLNLAMLEPVYFQNIFSLLNKAKENNEIYKINTDYDAEYDNKLLQSEVFDEKEDKSNQLMKLDINDENNENHEEINFYSEKKEYEPVPNKKSIYKLEKELSSHIRKFKKYLRRIPRLKYISEKIEDSYYINSTCQKILSWIKYIYYFYAIFCIFLFEYACLLTKEARKKEASKRKLEENEEDDTTVVDYILVLILSFVFIFLTSSYTIAAFFSLYKRNIIKGDLIYGKHQGDDINLISTTKSVAGLASALAYCNLYIFCYFNDMHMALYDVINFPEYDIGDGYNFLGIVRFLFLIVFGIISNSFEKIFCLRINDFGNSWKYLCLCK